MDEKDKRNCTRSGFQQLNFNEADILADLDQIDVKNMHENIIRPTCLQES